jgi:hypothetical protein
MIDPLEAIIAHLQSDATLVALTGGRIAARHEYGSGWRAGDPALIVRLSSGVPERDLPLQTLRIEADAYGSDQPGAVAIWSRLVEVSRNTQRVVVQTSGGKALLHSLQQASGPSLVVDPDVGMDVVLCFFDAIVAEDAILPG